MTVFALAMRVLQVQFHKGYFRDSLPPLRKAFKASGNSIALLRMDGEQIEPCVLHPLHAHVPRRLCLLC